MNEYKVGEVFTTEGGKTVQCVRSNGLCSGCIFHSVTGCEVVNIPEIQCDADLREDRQHVIFKELGELKEHTEYPVGRVLAFKGKVVEVVDNNDEKSCYNCAFFNYRGCNNILCIPCERMDENHVKFKEHVTEE